MRSQSITIARVLALGLALAALFAALAPARSLADVDPAGCTDGIAYDPAIPTYQDVVGRPLGDGPTGNTGRDLTADIYKYFRAVKDAAAGSSRVRMLEKSYGKSVLGQDLAFWVLSTPENIDNLDAGRKDAAFWAGVRDGSVSEAAGLAAVRSRPAPAWITSTPHGAEPTMDDWGNPVALSLGYVLCGAAGEFYTPGGQRDIDESFLVLMNAWHEDIDFTMPALPVEMEWEALVDTTDPVAIAAALSAIDVRFEQWPTRGLPAGRRQEDDPHAAAAGRREGHGAARGGSPEERPPAHVRRRQRRGVLGVRRRPADHADQPQAVPVRPDRGAVRRGRRDEAGLDGEGAHHLQLLPEGRQGDRLRVDARGRPHVPDAAR